MTRRRLALIVAPIALIALAALAPGRRPMLGYDFSGFRAQHAPTIASTLDLALPVEAPRPMIRLVYLIDELLGAGPGNEPPAPRLAYERVI